MPGEIAAAAIGAGASLLGAGGTAVANGKLNKKNRDWQEKMSALNYQRNKELFNLQLQANRQNWQMENDYNAPANQVKRLREAGLNPNLFYGNGSTAVTGGSIDSPSAFSADTSGAPGAIPYDFSQASNGVASAIASYQNWKINELNMEKIRNESQNIAAQTLLNTAQANKVDFGLNLDKKFAKWERLTGLSKEQTQVFLNRAQKRSIDIANFQSEAAFETKMALLGAQVFQARAAGLNSIGNFQDALARVRSGMYDAQAYNNRSQGNLNNQQFDFLQPYYNVGVDPRSSLMTLPSQFVGRAGQAASSAIDWLGRKIVDAKSYFKKK